MAPVKRKLGGALTTAGAICLRYALLECGKAVASDPQAVFEMQRQQQEDGAVHLEGAGQQEHPQFI